MFLGYGAFGVPAALITQSGAFWGRFGAILGSCSLLILLQVPPPIGAPFWGHLGQIWGLFGVSFPPDPTDGSVSNCDPIMGSFGAILGPFWGRVPS